MLELWGGFFFAPVHRREHHLNFILPGVPNEFRILDLGIGRADAGNHWNIGVLRSSP